MKHTLGKVVLGLVLLSFLGGTAWAQGRLATVDLRKVFDGYWKTKQADLKLKDRAAELEKDHKTMVDDWKKNKEEYTTLLGDANNQVLSPEERDKRKKAAEDKLKQIKEAEDAIQQYERQARTTLEEQKARMRESLLDEIKAALTTMAKSAGYTLVIDTTAVSANSTPVVIYAGNDNDMTVAILDQLNANAPVELLKADDKADVPKTDKKKDEKKK